MVGGYPDQYHGDPAGSVAWSLPHYPGTYHHCTTADHVRAAGYTPCSEGHDVSTRLLLESTLIYRKQFIDSVADFHRFSLFFMFFSVFRPRLRAGVSKKKVKTAEIHEIHGKVAKFIENGSKNTVFSEKWC